MQTLYVTAAHFARTTALHVPALLRFTHSSSTLNESANHPMHWTSQTILYLSSGCRRENNDSLTQVKEAMWLNQYFYYGPLHRRLPFECPMATFLSASTSVLLVVIEDFLMVLTMEGGAFIKSSIWQSWQIIKDCSETPLNMACEHL